MCAYRIGFTRRLIDKMSSQSMTTIPCYIEGPYGESHSYTHHDSVVCVAGGTGITHVLSVFLDVVAAHRRGNSAVRSLRLIWNIRHLADVNWVAPLLNQALAEPLDGLQVRIDLHLTKSHQSDEPGMPAGLSEAIAEHYNLVTSEPSNSATPAIEKALPHLDSQSTTVAGSSSGHSNSSNEKVNMEKPATSLTQLPVLAPRTLAAVQFHAGRSDLVSSLDEETSKATTSVGVCVCGPIALSLDTRKAVRVVNTGKRVMAGQAPIELSVEKFGW